MSIYKDAKQRELYRLLWQLSKNITPDGKTKCWEYKYGMQDNYVPIKCKNSPYFNSNSTSLHRMVYAIYHDQPLRPDQVIMHTCDNRICVNPKHLQLGTIQTNNADRTAKYRKKPK